MKTTVLDNQEAPNKRWAAQDASMRNLANKSHWSAAAQLRAERMRMGFELVYAVEKSYVSFGKKAVSIKLDHAQVKDAKNLALLESDYAKEGVTKKITNQGIIYTFK